MSSYAAITPEIPAPTMATSSPWCSVGIEPSPAGCAIQSSKGKGKSGPNIVTGRLCRLLQKCSPCSRSSIAWGNHMLGNTTHPVAPAHITPASSGVCGCCPQRYARRLSSGGRVPGPASAHPGGTGGIRHRTQRSGHAPRCAPQSGCNPLCRAQTEGALPSSSGPPRMR